MTAGWKRASLMILAATIFVGCDNDQNKADKQVQADLSDARQVALSSKDGAVDAAHKKLEDAASTAAASANVRAAAKSALAQADLEAAHQSMQKIDREELDLARAVWEISQLAEQIRTSNSAVVGFSKYDPKEAHDAIQEKIAEAQGGSGKAVWFQQGNATIPTLSAVKQQISELEGQIAQLQQQVKNLSDEQAHLIDTAEQAAAQADKLKGNEAVDVFKRSSDFRKQAGDKAVEIDKLQSQIDRLQRNLAIAQGQESTLNEVIAQLQDQSATLDAGWKQIADHVAAQQQLSAQILGTAGGSQPAAAEVSTAGQSIVQKALELDRLAKDIQKLREDAQLDASNSAKFFEDAYTAADEFRRATQTKITDPKNAGRPEIAVWKSMIAALDPQQFRLQQAAAQRTLGDLYLSNAASINRRISLRDSLKSSVEGTTLSVPAEINDPDLDKSMQNALTLANEAYDESDKLLGNIADSGASPELQGSALLNHALTLYGWAQIARLSGDEPTAASRIQLAIQDRNNAADHNIPIPAMPSELGTVPKAALPTTDTSATTQP
jgi:predicted nuclease with TOPRIM domain